MGNSINQVVISGRLGRDPESRAAGSGVVWTASVAVEEWKPGGPNREASKETFWFDVEAWEGRKGERPFPPDALSGALVVVTGKLRVDSWDDKATGKKAYKTRIAANNIGVLPDNRQGGGRDDRDGGGGYDSRNGGRGNQGGGGRGGYQGNGHGNGQGRGGQGYGNHEGGYGNHGGGHGGGRGGQGNGPRDDWGPRGDTGRGDQGRQDNGPQGGGQGSQGGFGGFGGGGPPGDFADDDLPF